MEKMSIHRALAEIKSYDDRISRAIRHQTYVIANKKSNDKIKGKSLEEVKRDIQKNYDRVESLISNKKKLKAAVVLSNATTKVTIDGVEYTVAEAIERKNMIYLEESLLNQLTSQYNTETLKVDNMNNELPEKLESYLQAILGEKDKRSADDIKMHTKAFNDRNMYELIDPFDIKGKIDKLYDEITKFKTEVDYKLSESNSTTFIEVDLTKID